MIQFIDKKQAAETPVSLTVSLAWEKRIKSRMRVVLDSGEEAAILLPRGTVLRGGDLLVSKEGLLATVRAAAETLSVVRTGDSLLLARLCYHLGNRHVALQISFGEIKYLHDHVLDEMVVGLGATVVVTESPFEPELGAYQAGSRHHHEHHQEKRHGHE